MKYGKAIRDNIPEIIRASGENCIVETLTNDEFLLELEKKLREEVEEYLRARALRTSKLSRPALFKFIFEAISTVRT